VLACFNASAKVAERVIRKENAEGEDKAERESGSDEQRRPTRQAALSQMANHWPPEITNPFFMQKVHARTVVK
jgi:hypothetical protein